MICNTCKLCSDCIGLYKDYAVIKRVKCNMNRELGLMRRFLGFRAFHELGIPFGVTVNTGCTMLGSIWGPLVLETPKWAPSFDVSTILPNFLAGLQSLTLTMSIILFGSLGLMACWCRVASSCYPIPEGPYLSGFSP